MSARIWAAASGWVMYGSPRDAVLRAMRHLRHFERGPQRLEIGLGVMAGYGVAHMAKPRLGAWQY